MNKSIVFSKPGKISKTQLRTLKKIEDDFYKEMYKQVEIVSGSFGIALYENFGWRKKKIEKFFNEINETWSEVSSDPNLSVLALCEQETGIELSIPEHDGSYKDLLYFNISPGTIQMTIQQKIYMRIRQKQWVGAEMIGAGLIALHRLYGFGYNRLATVYEQMTDVRERYNYDNKLIEAECYSITGVSMIGK